MNEIYRLIAETPTSVYVLAMVATMCYQLLACNIWESRNRFSRFIGTVMIQFPVLFTILLIVDGAK